MTAEQIAANYARNRATHRIAALFRFPADGKRCRASVFCRHAWWTRLLSDGLVEGVIGDANITPRGLEVRAILERQQ